MFTSGWVVDQREPSTSTTIGGWDANSQADGWIMGNHKRKYDHGWEGGRERDIAAGEETLTKSNPLTKRITILCIGRQKGSSPLRLGMNWTVGAPRQQPSGTLVLS